MKCISFLSPRQPTCFSLFRRAKNISDFIATDMMKREVSWNLSMMKRSGILSYKLSQALNFFPAYNSVKTSQFEFQNLGITGVNSWKFLLKHAHSNRWILIKYSSRMRNWSRYSKFHDFEILFSYPTESSSQARSDSPTLNQYYFPPLIIFSSCPVFCHPFYMWSPIGITAIHQKEGWRIAGVLFCRFFFIASQWAPAIIAD